MRVRSSSFPPTTAGTSSTARSRSRANTPYTFDWNEIEEEGTFSNLYYEALKASNLTTYSTSRQTEIINSYDNDACVTLHEDRYQDLILDGSESDPHAGHDHS